MAAGIKQGRVAITARQALSALADGVTYSHLEVQCVKGNVYMGNSVVTVQDGLQLPMDYPLFIEVALTAADLNFIGNGDLQFFGIATA